MSAQFKRLVVRESAVILVLSLVFSFGYAAISGRWLSRQQPEKEQATSAFISIDDAIARFKSDSGVFIDSRHAFDFDLGHIPGAINIPLGEFVDNNPIVRNLPRNKILVTYCDGQECNSSVALAQRFLAMGFTRVEIFFGGWNEWKASGAEIEGEEQ